MQWPSSRDPPPPGSLGRPPPPPYHMFFYTSIFLKFQKVECVHEYVDIIQSVQNYFGGLCSTGFEYHAVICFSNIISSLIETLRRQREDGSVPLTIRRLGLQIY